MHHLLKPDSSSGSTFSKASISCLHGYGSQDLGVEAHGSIVSRQFVICGASLGIGGCT